MVLKIPFLDIGLKCALVIITGVLFSAPSAAGPTLDGVKSRGYVSCGVNISSRPGFSSLQPDGSWVGIDVDFCRSVAAAVFSDATKVKYIPLTTKERMSALSAGKIDLLSRNTTWTLSRDASLGITFVGVLYYDGQGFMVRKDLGASTPLDFNGSRVCVIEGTTSYLNLEDYSKANGLSVTWVRLPNPKESFQAYDAGNCEVITGDQSALYAWKGKLKAPHDHEVLPHIISKEPLGPAVRNGDFEWFKIVRWVLFAIITAEELGITSTNVNRLAAHPNRPIIRRFLGLEGTFGADLYLPKTWTFDIIRQVGNYGEMFHRNLGSGSVLKNRRGINALWDSGGLLYSPPFR